MVEKERDAADARAAELEAMVKRLQSQVSSFAQVVTDTVPDQDEVEEPTENNENGGDVAEAEAPKDELTAETAAAPAEEPAAAKEEVAEATEEAAAAEEPAPTEEVAKETAAAPAE
jgi:peptidoglycan hydrolase CwlO-like protein